MNSKQVAGSLAGTIVKIVIIVVIVMVLIRLAGSVYDFGYRIFAEEAVNPDGDQEVAVAIVEGRSARQIAELLEEKGLVRDANLFYIQQLLSGEEGTVQAGVYRLNTNMTPDELIAVLMAGPTDDTADDTEAGSDN